MKLLITLFLLLFLNVALQNKASQKFSHSINQNCLKFSMKQSFPELISSLVCGKKPQDKNPTFDAIKRSGLIHFFVISGLHILIVINTLQRLKAPTWIITIALFSLGVISLWQPPLKRALFFYLVSKISLQHKAFWPKSIRHLLTGIILLTSQPELSHYISFYLSFSAAIALSYPQRKITPLIINLFTFGFLTRFTNFSILYACSTHIFTPFFLYLILPTTLLDILVPLPSQVKSALQAIIYFPIKQWGFLFPEQIIFKKHFPQSIAVLLLILLLINLYCFEFNNKRTQK